MFLLLLIMSNRPMRSEVQKHRSIVETSEWFHLCAILLYFCTSSLFFRISIKSWNLYYYISNITIGEIMLMFLTILLYFCASILTILYFVKCFSFRAQNKLKRSGLKPQLKHQIIAQKLSYFMNWEGWV